MIDPYEEEQQEEVQYLKRLWGDDWENKPTSMRKAIKAGEHGDLSRLRGVCRYWIDKAETDEEKIVAKTLDLFMSGGDPFEREKKEHVGVPDTSNWKWEAMKLRCEGAKWLEVLDMVEDLEKKEKAPSDESHLKRTVYNHFKRSFQLPEKQNMKMLEQAFKQAYGRK